MQISNPTSPSQTPGQMLCCEQSGEIAQRDFIVVWRKWSETNSLTCNFDQPSLIVCLDGALKLEFDHDTLTLRARQFALIRIYGNSKVKVYQQVTGSFIIIHFALPFFKKLNRNGWLDVLLEEQNFSQSPLLFNAALIITPIITTYIDAIISTAVEREGSRLIILHVENVFKQVLRLMCVGDRKCKTLFPGYQEMLQVQQNLQAQFHLPYTPDEIARQSGLTDYNLYRQFKVVTDSTAIEFIINLRVQKAMSLLAETTLPVSEISKQVGFKRTADLHRALIRAIGTGPRQFRNNARASSL